MRRFYPYGWFQEGGHAVMERYRPHEAVGEKRDYKQERRNALKVKEQLIARYGADWQKKASLPELRKYYDAEALVRKMLIRQVEEEKRVEEERRKAEEAQVRVVAKQKKAETEQLRREALQRAQDMGNYPSIAEQMKAGLAGRYGAGWEKRASAGEVQQYYRQAALEAQEKNRQKELLPYLSARVRLDDLQRQNDSLMTDGLHPFQLMSNRQEAGQLLRYLGDKHPEMTDEEFRKAYTAGKGMMVAGKYIFPQAAPLFNGINNAIDVGELVRNPRDTLNQMQVGSDVLSQWKSRRTGLQPFGVMGDAMSVYDIYKEASQYGEGGPYNGYQNGGGTGWPAGVPSPQEMAMAAALQKAFAPEREAAPSQREEKKKEEPRKKVMLPPPEPRVRGDIGAGLPTRGQVEGLIQQRVAEQQRLQGQLERAGYKGAYAAAMSRQGRSKLPEHVQKKLDNQEASDYRVQHHPDYDPSRPVEDQQYLNYDNSLRTRVLRGANMFVDSGDPVVDFVAGTMTAPGRAFANITMDAEKRYVEPIVNEGWRGVPGAVGNLGMDVMDLATTNAVGNRIANRLVSRGLPESSVAMERQLLKSWKPPVGAGTEGVSRNFISESGSPIDYLKDKVDDFRGELSKPLGRRLSEEEIKQAAYSYYNLTKNPRYIERVRALDKELGLNGELEKRLQLYHQQGEQLVEGKLPFNMKVVEDMALQGASLPPPEVVMIYNKAKKAGDVKTMEKIMGKYYSPQVRELHVSPKEGAMKLDDVLWHEMKHHWLNGLHDKSPGIQKYAEWLRSMGPRLDAEHELYDMTKDDFNYYLTPTELDAYLMTNVRNDMVRNKLLKDHFSELTEDMLDDYLMQKLYMQNPASPLISTYFNPGQELIDKKRFVKIFNKALPVATGVGVGAGVMGAAAAEKKWGGVIGPAPQARDDKGVRWYQDGGGVGVSNGKGYAKNNFFNRMFNRNAILEEQIRDEYGALKRIPLRRLHVDYASGADADTLAQLGHNPEFIGPEEGVRDVQFGNVRIPKGKMWVNGDSADPRFVGVRHPGDYTTLVNPEGLSGEEIKRIAGNDFVSHALRGDSVYDALSGELGKMLVEKYGDRDVRNNGGVDAYIRGLISDDPEYDVYREEMGFVPQGLKDRIVNYIKMGKVGRVGRSNGLPGMPMVIPRQAGVRW